MFQAEGPSRAKIQTSEDKDMQILPKLKNGVGKAEEERLGLLLDTSHQRSCGFLSVLRLYSKSNKPSLEGLKQTRHYGRGL